jgi:hypothetical protein
MKARGDAVDAADCVTGVGASGGRATGGGGLCSSGGADGGGTSVCGADCANARLGVTQTIEVINRTMVLFTLGYLNMLAGDTDRPS